MSASNEELTNLRLHFKLGAETFEYYFQIILGLNFQIMFKISQDATDNEDLYLHIRNRIVTFSFQSINTNNYICTWECVQIKPKDWKQFTVKAPRGLKCGEIYEINFNANGLPKGIIPICEMFIARAHQKFISIALINQWKETVLIPRGQHIGSV